MVQQLLGPLELWFGGTTDDLETIDIDPTDQRGKEELEWEDFGFKAVVRPGGLLNGL